MKNIFFFILLGPLLLSQNYQTKDSLKTLAKSNFKSMKVFENRKGKLIPTRDYSYDQNKKEITIKNSSDKNKEWVKTIIRLDNDFNVREEEKIIEGMVISEKENTFVNQQVSMIKQYLYSNNTLQINNYNSKGNLSNKKFSLFDDKNRVIENLLLLKDTNNIIIDQIEKYTWIDDKSYNYEKLTFSFPKTKIVGIYKLNKYGEIQSFKGNMTVNDSTEIYDYNLADKLKQYDSKGNLIKVYTLDDGKENILEERKIVY